MSTKHVRFSPISNGNIVELMEDDTEALLLIESLLVHIITNTTVVTLNTMSTRLEALCYKCGCILLSDIVMLSLNFIIYSYGLFSFNSKMRV